MNIPSGSKLSNAVKRRIPGISTRWFGKGRRRRCRHHLRVVRGCSDCKKKLFRSMMCKSPNRKHSSSSKPPFHFVLLVDVGPAVVIVDVADEVVVVVDDVAALLVCAGDEPPCP